MSPRKEWLWSQAYRPKTITECILPERYKEMFEGYIRDGIPNLLLAGSQGVGKCLGYNTLIYLDVDEKFLEKCRENNIEFSSLEG